MAHTKATRPAGLGSDGTDLLVELVRSTGAKGGFYGAKITGGGSGGAVAILGRADAGPATAEVVQEYRRRTGQRGRVLQHFLWGL